MKHIFPDVPIHAGCFAPIHIAPPNGTFSYARYPRPVAGCAAEVAQRIMERFRGDGKAIPDRLFAAPAGTSGNFRPGGYDPEENRHYIMLPVQPAAGTAGGGRPTAHQRLLERRISENPARRDPRTALPISSSASRCAEVRRRGTAIAAARID